MIIAMNQIMQDLSNEDVQLPFQSNDFTHGLMWWKYVFIHTHEQMVNQHMANEILNHQFACHDMLTKISQFLKNHIWTQSSFG
jgi:hypothetical protein